MLKKCQCGEILGDQRDGYFIVRNEHHKELYLYGWVHIKCPNCKKHYFAKEEK